MIEGNVLKFGYGDISVGAVPLSQFITFQQFKPPAKCGDRLAENVEYIGDSIVINIDHKDYCEFKRNLESISKKDISEFTFKGYVFDFTNFNEDSVKVCKKYIKAAMSMYFLLLAA